MELQVENESHARPGRYLARAAEVANVIEGCCLNRSVALIHVPAIFVVVLLKASKIDLVPQDASDAAKASAELGSLLRLVGHKPAPRGRVSVAHAR